MLSSIVDWLPATMVFTLYWDVDTFMWDVVVRWDMWWGSSTDGSWYRWLELLLVGLNDPCVGHHLNA